MVSEMMNLNLEGYPRSVPEKCTNLPESIRAQRGQVQPALDSRDPFRFNSPTSSKSRDFTCQKPEAQPHLGLDPRSWAPRVSGETLVGLGDALGLL